MGNLNGGRGEGEDPVANPGHEAVESPCLFTHSFFKKKKLFIF